MGPHWNPKRDHPWRPQTFSWMMMTSQKCNSNWIFFKSRLWAQRTRVSLRRMVSLSGKMPMVWLEVACKPKHIMPNSMIIRIRSTKVVRPWVPQEPIIQVCSPISSAKQIIPVKEQLITKMWQALPISINLQEELLRKLIRKSQVLGLYSINLVGLSLSSGKRSCWHAIKRGSRRSWEIAWWIARLRKVMLSTWWPRVRYRCLSLKLKIQGMVSNRLGRSRIRKIGCRR